MNIQISHSVTKTLLVSVAVCVITGWIFGQWGGVATVETLQYSWQPYIISWSSFFIFQWDIVTSHNVYNAYNAILLPPALPSEQTDWAIHSFIHSSRPICGRRATLLTTCSMWCIIQQRSTRDKSYWTPGAESPISAGRNACYKQSVINDIIVVKMHIFSIQRQRSEQSPRLEPSQNFVVFNYFSCIAR